MHVPPPIRLGRLLRLVPLAPLALLGASLPACEAGYTQVRNPRDLQTTEAASRLEPVTRGAGDQVNPAVSPNGRLLAYEARTDEGSQVIVAPIATPDRERFHIAAATDPSWMPDGSSVVIVSEAEHRWQIMKRELAAPTVGALLIPLGDPKHDALWPSVSADGKTLATSLVGLHVFDTKDLHRRWFNAALELTPTNGYGLHNVIGDGVEASWSPNPRDRSVAFIREADGHGHVFVAGPSGKAVQITDGPDEDADPTWSPDGKYLAFCSAHASEDGMMGATANIFVVGRDGGSFTQLTEGDVFACRPSWSRDGWIYFHASQSKGGFHIWRVRWLNEGASRDLIPELAPKDDPADTEDPAPTETEAQQQQ